MVADNTAEAYWTDVEPTSIQRLVSARCTYISHWDGCGRKMAVVANHWLATTAISLADISTTRHGRSLSTHGILAQLSKRHDTKRCPSAVPTYYDVGPALIRHRGTYSRADNDWIESKVVFSQLIWDGDQCWLDVGPTSTTLEKQ